MEKLFNIIRDNRMSTSPEYYSGRGATMSDLDYDILVGIHRGIEREFGVDAAKNFVNMVADIKVLSATTFLQELYNLFYSDWKYVEKEQHAHGVSVPKNEDGEYDMQAGMFGMIGMMTAMFGNDRDDTEQIRGHFIRSNGHKPKGKTRYYSDEWGYCYCYCED